MADETQMIPGYTGKTGAGRKLIGKPPAPYEEYDADMEELATYSRSNLFPGSTHDESRMESSTHRTLKQTGKVWEKGYEVDSTFHTKWSEDKDVMELTLAYQRQQKIFKAAEDAKAK